MSLTTAQSGLSRCPKCTRILDDSRIPPAVTFMSGAQLLMDLGIVDHITHQGLRHIATADRYKDVWPFGPGKAYPYWQIGNATAMASSPFIAFFEEHYHSKDTPS